MDKLTQYLTTFMCRYMPDAFTFCLLLTVFVFGAAFYWSNQTLLQLIELWGQGIWSLLAFTMQMCLILAGGQALAHSPPIERGLQSLVNQANTPRKAIVILTLASLSASWFNWGLGLIVGGILAQRIAQRHPSIPGGLFFASAYSGFLVWHGGLSGSIPLSLASPSSLSAHLGDIQTLPLSETIFSLTNLLLVGILFVSLPLLNMSFLPRSTHNDRKHRPNEVLSRHTKQPWDSSRLLGVMVIAFGLAYLWYHMSQDKSFGLNEMNLLLLLLAFLLNGHPTSFLKAFKAGANQTSPIMLQFPFYGGIMALVSKSGLGNFMAKGIVSMATPNTYPLLTFFSAGLLNFLVPSGGGQWVIQGPVAIEAAQTLGLPLQKAALAVLWGDAWSNLIQPFWALPLLAAAKIKVQEMMGYNLLIFFWSGLVIGLGLTFFSF